jgi:trehalose 6-phosphate synthase
VAAVPRRPARVDVLREQWDAYVAVNERFAATLADIAPADAIVWIHDYQLQLVPEMLRAQRTDVTIGFFLHIPFPPYELFSRLPWRTEIVEGCSAATCVGFQRPMGGELHRRRARTPRHVDAHDDVIENPGSPHTSRRVPDLDRRRDVEEMAAGRATRQRMSQIRARLGDPEVILLGVDRLDYTKGIGLRLKAFAALLESGELDPSAT